MVKFFRPFLGRVMMSISNNMLRYRVARVSPLEELAWRSASSAPMATLAGEVSSAFSCSDAASFPGTALTTDWSSCGCQQAAPSFNVNQRIEKSTSSSSSGRWHGSSELKLPRLSECSRRSASLTSLSRSICKPCGFTTAAINITEPGKSWRGKGWNRVRVEENASEVSEPSSSSQFDGIPHLEEKLEFLETCGLGDNQLEQMRKRLPSAVKNTFLKLSMKKLIEVATFLEEEVGVPKKDFGNLLFANPYIAGSSVDDCLRPKIIFLRNRGISKEQMGKMVIRSPQILSYSLEGKLLVIEQKLLEVGLKGDEVGRVFVKYPALFGTSISKFDKNVQALKDGGIIEVAKAIFKIPQIMSLSLDTKFEQVMHFLRDELKLQQEQISKILCCQISILSFSVHDNMRPKVGYFSELGLQQDDIARLVVKYPNLFCHSLENSIKPKVQYLMKVMNLQVLELTSFPHYLSYSLPDRIIPRHEYVTKHGFNFRLSSLLSCCDNVFHKRYPKPQDTLAGLLEQKLCEQYIASIPIN